VSHTEKISNGTKITKIAKDTKTTIGFVIAGSRNVVSIVVRGRNGASLDGRRVVRFLPSIALAMTQRGTQFSLIVATWRAVGALACSGGDPVTAPSNPSGGQSYGGGRTTGGTSTGVQLTDDFGDRSSLPTIGGTRTSRTRPSIRSRMRTATTSGARGLHIRISAHRRTAFPM
jgi:hypothetical protein